jgi:glycosyltransferase involved in cell wall biosynthesis
MKIVEIAWLDERVPPKKYGGTELVIGNVTKGLIQRGHEVYLFGTGDSITGATTISFLPKPIREMYPFEELVEWRRYYTYKYLAEILEKLDEIKPDIIHNNIGWTLLQFEKFIKYPIVTTLHGPLTTLDEKAGLTDKAHLPYVSISKNQSKAMPNINWVRNIYHGIEVSRFDAGKTEDRDYFLFLGRISPEKGIAEICKMISGTKHKLVIAAKLDPNDKEYYDREVAPLVDGEKIKYVGEVDHEGKKELLSHAKALLMWLNWEEPFGLTVIESFASGTPVVVNPRGSMRELMQNGRTGFLVESLDEMKERLDNVDQIDNAYCREYCELRFSYQRMADEYIRLFEEIIAGSPVEPEPKKQNTRIKLRLV